MLKSIGCKEAIKSSLHEIRELFLKEGSHTLKEILDDPFNLEIKCEEICGALTLLKSYWHDITRPALMALACQAVGGDSKLVAGISKGLILLSGGIDVHDDIIDCSRVKKDHHTVYGAYGRDIALITGDLLLGKGMMSAIENVPPEKISYVAMMIRKLFFELAEGEALELNFRRNLNVRPEKYLEVVKKKAADAEAYTRIGAYVGGGLKEEVDSLGRYGRILGMLAILRDDLEDTLDFSGELLSRIKNESLPLPVIYALQKSQFRAKLIPILDKDISNLNEKDGKLILDLTVEGGSLNHFRSLLRDLAGEATYWVRNIRRHKEIFEQIIKVTIPPI